ncbi:hypothetical protein H5T87_08685 [bacterium]|nr:hypothetical protein [bacterium]
MRRVKSWSPAGSHKSRRKDVNRTYRWVKASLLQTIKFIALLLDNLRL